MYIYYYIYYILLFIFAYSNLYEINALELSAGEALVLNSDWQS